MTTYTICLLDAGELPPTDDITTLIAQLNINKYKDRYVRVTADGKIVGYVMYEQYKTATYKDFR
jgi:hypothetical protein